jgi:RIO kinase 2
MSQVRRAAQTTELLQDEDYLILTIFVKCLKDFDRVPSEVIMGLSSKPKDRVDFRLSRLEKLGLISGGPRGFKLVALGLDALALHSYARRNLLARVGPSIAVGKESDVFEAIDRNEHPYALKFFRLGRISFRDIKRKRGYAAPEEHAWLKANIQAASREARALKALEGYGLPVPSLKSFYYHTVLMEMEMGIPLFKVKQLDDAGEVLERVVDALRDCCAKGGLVNGDVSEYNVLITPEHRIVIIDWPQALPKAHPNAIAYLQRDVTNIVRFFNRRYGLRYDMDGAIRRVLSAIS